MKFTTTAAASALLLTTLQSSTTTCYCSAQQQPAEATPPGCLTEVNANRDYFPVKVEPTESQNWKVEYFKTYKVVENLAVNETYLLYQCGSNLPSAAQIGGFYTAVLEIPIRAGVAVDQTPTIPFLEHLGLVEEIKAFTSDPQFISSPCLLESIEAGNVVVLEDPDDFASTNTNTADIDLRTLVALVGAYNADSPFQTVIKVSEASELTNAAIFEWIKYYSTFFNLEELATQLFEAAESRWDCVSENANRVAADSPSKPVVLWGYYSDYCEGWDVGECPNYYCEYAQECSVDIISSTEGTLSELCDAVYMTTEQFVELGKDADYWIYPSSNFDKAYELFKDELDTMKAVQESQVYDYQASGSNAWFEQRFAEYYAVLQDFCSIVGTTAPLEERSWFRNVETGTIGDLGNCADNSFLLNATDCEDLTPPSPSPAPVPAPGTTSEAVAVVASSFRGFAILALALSLFAL